METINKVRIESGKFYEGSEFEVWAVLDKKMRQVGTMTFYSCNPQKAGWVGHVNDTIFSTFANANYKRLVDFSR